MNTNWSIFDNKITIEDIETSETFSEAIYKLLKMKRFRLKDLAKEIECTPKHLSELTYGKTPLTIKTARKLEKVSNVSDLDWFRLYLNTYQD